MRIGSLWGSLIVLALWYLVTMTGLISRLFLPAPHAVFSELARLTLSFEIVWDIFETLHRTLLGFVVGGSLGIAAGLAVGYYRRLYYVMEFPVDFFRSIPPTALFPLFIVIWGLGDGVKMFVAAWTTGMVVLINTIYGLRSVSLTRLMVAKTKNASVLRTFWRVILPNALPYIVAGLRIGMSLALIVEIVAEMFLGSHSGLGRRIFNATSILEMEEAYAAILVVGLVGYSLNKAILMAEKRIVHWSGK